MCTLLRDNFGRIGMGHHRVDLLQRLNHILRQLDLGLSYLQQYKPSLNEGTIQQMKEQYGKLNEVLLEVDGTATDKLIRKLPGLAGHFSLLTSMVTTGYHSTFMCAIPLPHP